MSRACAKGVDPFRQREMIEAERKKRDAIVQNYEPRTL